MAPKDGSHRSFHLRKTLADLTTKARASRRKHQVIPLPALPSNLDAKDDYVYDILYECQRGSWMVGYSSKTLLQFDPNPWCDANMNFTPMKPSTFQLPDPTWEWVNKEWLVDLTGDVDEAGWQYAVRFHGAKWHGNYKHFRSFVRRRRWIRLRHKMKSHAATDAQQQQQHDTIPAAMPARVGQLVDIDDQAPHQHHHHTSASATSNDDAVGWTTRFTRARLDRERIQVLTNLPVPEKVALLAKQTLLIEHLDQLDFEDSKRRVLQDLLAAKYTIDQERQEVSLSCFSSVEKQLIDSLSFYSDICCILSF